MCIHIFIFNIFNLQSWNVQVFFDHPIASPDFRCTALCTETVIERRTVGRNTFSRDSETCCSDLCSFFHPQKKGCVSYQLGRLPHVQPPVSSGFRPQSPPLDSSTQPAGWLVGGIMENHYPPVIKQAGWKTHDFDDFPPAISYSGWWLT